MAMASFMQRPSILPSIPSSAPTSASAARMVAVSASSDSASGSDSGSGSSSSSSGSGSSGDLVKKGWTSVWGEDKLGRSVNWLKNTASHLLLTKAREVKGLWDMCDACGEMLYTRSTDETLATKRICPQCGHHLRRSSTDRIDMLADAHTWAPLDQNMLAVDALGFRDQEAYAKRLDDSRKRSGLTDAVQTGLCTIEGTPVALGVMDFRFMGGSMGSVVGEKITRLVERATQLRIPLVVVCSSGGARMQEGTLSLMQMAKVSAALQVHQQQHGLLYIPILTNPTTGGITASFGMLGDINIAEPKAYVAFAGGRVIAQTLGKKLPDNFQTAEYVFDHGLVDVIVPGSLLKSTLAQIFDLYASAPQALKRKREEQPVVTHY